MKIVEFVGQDRLLGPPVGFNDGQRAVECGALPVRLRVEDGMAMFDSYWKPSREEIDQLIGGACIRLTVFGPPHPPVAIAIEQVEILP